MLKKMLFICSVLSTHIMAQSDTDNSWQQHVPEIKDACVKLQQAANAVALHQDHKKALKDCLSNDCLACTKLLTSLQNKVEQDKKLFHESTMNGIGLVIALWDYKHYHKDEDAKKIIALQARADDLLAQLNEIMPGEYTLWVYHCPKSEAENMKEIHALAGDGEIYCYNSDLRYILVITDNKKKNIEMYECIDRENETLMRYIVAELCSEDVSWLKIPAKLKKFSTNLHCETSGCWQRIYTSELEVPGRTDVKVICTKTGKLGDVLELVHKERMDDLMQKLKVVINSMSQP